MKNFFLLVSMLTVPTLAIAVTETPTDVMFRTAMYGIKISQNGEWLGSRAGDASAYNIFTKTYYDYWGSFYGLGNCMANNGMAVGYSQDRGVILYKGETIFPETLNTKEIWFCDIHAITPDATRLAGILNNPAGGEMMHLPFISDISEDGTVGEPVILPHPTIDFFGMTPQRATAVWMSNDGKTVVGDLVDWRGMYTVPIIYTESESGDWNYYLPSEQLFNPTNIELPENPWKYEPPAPEFVNFMSPLARAAYEQAYDDWAANGYNGQAPDPSLYMTQDQIEAYNAAANEYNAWAKNPDVEEAIQNYIKIYFEVLETSPDFEQNDMTIHPDGSYIMHFGSFRIDDNNNKSYIYKFNTRDKEYQRYNLPPRYNPMPRLILSDGTLISSSGPVSFILEPESTEFISYVDYIATEYPEVATWIDLNFPGVTGIISMSDDKSITIGAGTVNELADYTGDEDFYYWTYIFAPGTDIGGVEGIAAEPTDVVYKVYNLQGVKMLETKNTNEINTLAKGIYIVNGKKVMIR